jgi:2-polyprenyl-6-hydroxyphenyl methylase/3-demethylubiquinone-9 3-methyltransferase
MTTLHPNVDAQEISKFEELASRWWDPDSEFKPLHDLNPRCGWITSMRGSAAGRETSALDVGCGGGILAESMALRGARGYSASTWAKRRWQWRNCINWNPGGDARLPT